MICASWGPLGSALGALWGCLWGLLGCLEAILGCHWGHLGPCGGHLGLSWTLGASWAHFGATGGRPGAFQERMTPFAPFGGPPPPNRLDRAPGGGVWGGGSISHADEPQGVGGFSFLKRV